MATADNNNSTNTKNLNNEPTLSDILKELQKVASKQDISDISNEIKVFNTKSKERFEQIEEQITNIVQTHNERNELIASLAENVEQLKQDKLRNNIRISGIIPDWDGDCKELVMKIITKLNVQASVSDFTSYATANKKFVIVSFFNYAHKAAMLSKMRIKRSLFVEELFPATKSKSQLYLNDHLTPYFNDLFITAFKAKKDGKLFSASSWGGRIRVRQTQNDPPKVIMNVDQLNDIIQTESANSSTVNMSTEDGASSSAQVNKENAKSSNNKKGDKTTPRTYKKRKASNSGSEGRSEKNPRISSFMIQPSKLTGNTNTIK